MSTGRPPLTTTRTPAARVTRRSPRKAEAAAVKSLTLPASPLRPADACVGGAALVFWQRDDERRVMGTIVFLILRFAFGYNFYGDAQTFATLVSLDTIALILLVGFFRKGRG
ncbi:MAG: hypothetical protein R6U36_02575 [Candidatus Fermentibacteraceae bacterium]